MNSRAASQRISKTPVKGGPLVGGKTYPKRNVRKGAASSSEGEKEKEKNKCPGLNAKISIASILRVGKKTYLDRGKMEKKKRKSGASQEEMGGLPKIHITVQKFGRKRFIPPTKKKGKGNHEIEVTRRWWGVKISGYGKGPGPFAAS